MSKVNNPERSCPLLASSGLESAVRTTAIVPAAKAIGALRLKPSQVIASPTTR